jgi:UDP-N-acetylglucosamine 2-epimerase
MLIKIEEVLARERPHLALVYGDTNSTLAGALAAAKLNIPVAHVEAGMRSFNRQMPEEINRVAADNVSVLHFCSTRTAVKNLQNEGIREGIFLPGDVMYDAAVQSIAAAENYSTVLRDIKVQPKGYFLATVHRQSNTDDPGNLKSILDAFARMDKPVVFPVHPRTRKALHAAGAMRPGSTGRYRNILFTDPVGYLDMLVLEKNAGMILTDSGGVQKEAYFFGVPCVTLRDETEWIETIQAGGNELAGADTARILRAAGRAHPPVRDRGIFGNGNAGRNICRIIAARRGEYT